MPTRKLAAAIVFIVAQRGTRRRLCYTGGRKGSIQAGKLADLVVLGRDPHRVRPGEIIRIPIEPTMGGGRWVFEA